MKQITKAWWIFWLGILGLGVGITMFVNGIHYGWLAGTPGMEERADHLQSLGLIWGWLSWLILGSSVVAIAMGVKLVNKCDKSNDDNSR